MATHSGKLVRVLIPRGVYALRQKSFIRNGKAIKMKGTVRRGDS
ncbi:MAG: hypothetical protein ACYC64_19175 [Armatimonadota bacterium]